MVELPDLPSAVSIGRTSLLFRGTSTTRDLTADARSECELCLVCYKTAPARRSPDRKATCRKGSGCVEPAVVRNVGVSAARVGFFGLGTGYLIYGPKELFGFPKGDDAAGESAINRSLGIWGIWLPGFCQFVTGVILFIGLTWLNVFTKSAPL